MKKLLSILLTVALLCAMLPTSLFGLTASAATSGTTGDCTWTLDGTVLTISGNGAMGNYSYSSAPWGTDIIKVVIQDGVTNIGDYAFYNCDSLLKVTIPNSVTSIGYEAFRYCTGLISITIPDSVTSIGSSAFRSCSSLTSITIPNSVTSIGYEAFRYCDSLKDVYITDLAAWCNIYFASESANPLHYNDDAILYLNGQPLKNAIIPDSVTSIGNYAFYNCTGLTSITIPNSVTSIGESAFAGCSNLNEVHITDLSAWCNIVFALGASYNVSGKIFSNPLRYAKNFFLNGELLTDIIIPKGVTTLGNGIFYYYESLSSITIPDSVTSIGSSAFEYCTGLKEVHITDLAAWCSIDFADGYANPLYYADNGLYLNGQPIENAVIPGSVTTIPEKAFYNCPQLKSVVVPNSVLATGAQAFYNCSGLQEVTLGNGLMAVYKDAFNGCTNLTTAKYTGTQAQWNEVIVLDGNDALLNVLEVDSGECAHQYAYPCSTACSLCRQPRTDAADHTYTNACDTDCNVCRTTRATQHSYTADCDTVCDICSSTRTADVAHTYSHDCDSDCNKCGTLRTVKDHVFTNAQDPSCNICGALRDVTVTVPTTNNATLIAPDAAAVGETVEVLVYIQNCPDVSSVAVELAYSDCFEFINAEWLQAGSLSNFDSNTNKGALSGLESANINGNLLKITLKAAKEIDNAEVNVRIIAKNSDVVVMDATATKDIAFGTPGDLNEDGKVTDADAVHLLMHTFFPDTYPVAQNCDYNGDGKVTDADAVHLLMYTFFPETYPIA